MSKVNLTIAFDSVDEALVALAAFSQVKVKPGVAANKGGDAATPAATPPAAQDAKPPRKPRADRGQPRGPYKKDSEADAAGAPADTSASGATPTPEVASPAAPTAAASAEESETAAAPVAAEPPAQPSAAEYTDQQLQDKLSAVFSKGAQLAIDTLGRFGVTRLKDLAKEHRAEFAALCDKVVAGGQP